MAFSLLGNKIGGINDITANHQCAFKPGYGTFAEKPAYQPQQQGGSNQYTLIEVIYIPHRKR